MVHFHHHDDTCVWGACNIVTSSTRPWMWDVWWRRWLTSHSRRRSTLIRRKRFIDLLVRWWQGWGRCEFSWCFARCLRTWQSLLAGELSPWFWLHVGSRQCVHPYSNCVDFACIDGPEGMQYNMYLIHVYIFSFRLHRLFQHFSTWCCVCFGLVSYVWGSLVLFTMAIWEEAHTEIWLKSVGVAMWILCQQKWRTMDLKWYWYDLTPDNSSLQFYLGGGFIYIYIFMFNPIWGNDPFWLIFFQMGWNHQLA